MAKYFLINYEKLPEECKNESGFIRYINFGIFLFILLIFFKQSEQQLISSSDPLFNKVRKEVSSELEVIENTIESKISNIVKKEKLDALPEYASEKMEKLAKTFESEIQEHQPPILHNTHNSHIVINIKKAIDDDKLSVLLLVVFEELHLLGEDQAYIDMERNKLGAVVAVHIKGLKNLDTPKLKKLMQKVNQETGITISKS